MRIHVAGIAHFDPLCRNRLQDWIALLLRRNPSHPAFVAVEWDQQMFSAVRTQRPAVRALAKGRWPSATGEFLDALESAVAFEGDTHSSVAPQLPTLWLDNGRELPYADAIDRYAPDRIKVYASYIPRGTETFDSDLLHTMSREAWNSLGARQEGGTDRDPRFAEAIATHPTLPTNEWAIAIVGANHASRDPGYMVDLLEAQYIPCEVSELRPNPDAA